MAPERLRGGTVTPASDVYALASCSIGRCPGGCRGRFRLSRTSSTRTYGWNPRRLPNIPGLPGKVADLCLRSLAKAPEDRPTAAEIAVTLGRIARVPTFIPPAGPAAPPVALTHTALTQTASTHTARLRALVSTPTLAMAPPTSPPQHRFAVILGGLMASVLGIFAWGIPGAQRPAGVERGRLQAGGDVPGDLSAADGTQNSFSAVVTVRNDGLTAVSPWQVEFAWPGDQTLLAAQGVEAQQQGRAVVLRGDRLDPGGRAEVFLTGSYDQFNALPSQFALAGSACETVILGSPPVEPIVQVVNPTPAHGKHKKMGK
jgi:serine/threonine-protein kinase